MKRLSLFLAIILSVYINVFAQYNDYPDNMINIERYKQNGIENFIAFNSGLGMDHAYAGKQHDYDYEENTFRMIYSWDLSSIPTNAVVSSCTLYVAGTLTSNAPDNNPYYVEFKIKRFPDNKISSLASEQWTAITSAQDLDTQQPPRNPGYFDTYYIYDSGSNFVNYVQSCISQQKVHLSIKGSDESWSGSTTVHVVDFKLNPNISTANALKLKIDYTVPPVTITADNNFTDNSGNGTRGTMVIDGTTRTIPSAGYAFTKNVDQNLSLSAVSPQTDNQGYQEVWHTGTSYLSNWTRSGITRSYDQMYSFSVTAEDAGKTYMANLRQIKATTSGTLSSNETWFGSATLAGKVTVPSGVTLTITSDAVITLGSNSIVSSGGTITLSSSATINGLKAKTLSGSVLKGICGKLQDAIDVASAYDDIDVSDVTINENISIVDKTNINLHDVDLSGNISMTNSDYMVLQDNTCNNIYISNCDYPWIWRVVVEGSGSGNGVSLYNVGFLSPYGNSSISVDNFENGLYAISSTFGMESHYYSIFTNVENGVVGYANANLTLNSVNLCDVSDYHLISSYGSYIYANGCYYYNGTPIIQETAGTVETVSNQSCGSLSKISASENIVNAYSADEFGKINTKLREFSERINLEMDEKGKFDAKDYKDEVLDIADLCTQYITNTESKHRGAAVTTAVHCYKSIEEYEAMKDFLEELKDDAEIGGYAGRYMIDYYCCKKEFENAIKTADELLGKSDSELDNIVLYSKGLVLAHDMNKPEQASVCFSTIIENDADKGLTALAENQLSVLGYEVDKSVTKSGEIENNGIELDNYPNPFNPSTTISYTLPEAGAVQIKIYDILGREVAKLVDEQKSAGKYTVNWNGSNYASGVYFTSITFNNQRLYVKITI